MSKAQHATIELERTFEAPVARVFAAWEDTEALARWCCPGDESWTSQVIENDFRVDGLKRITFGPPGETPYREVTRYLNIVRDSRLICVETILRGDRFLSASIITLEFAPVGDGTLFSVTDQLTLVDPADKPEARQSGWGEVLQKLGAELAQR